MSNKEAKDNGQDGPVRGHQGIDPLPPPIGPTVEREALGDFKGLTLRETEPIPLVILLETGHHGDDERTSLRDTYKELLERVTAAGNNDRILELDDYARYVLLNEMYRSGRVVVAAAGAAVRGRFKPKKRRDEDGDAFIARRDATIAQIKEAFEKACRFVMHPGGTKIDQTALDALTAEAIAAREAREAKAAAQPPTPANEPPASPPPQPTT